MKLLTAALAVSVFVLSACSGAEAAGTTQSPIASPKPAATPTSSPTSTPSTENRAPSTPTPATPAPAEPLSGQVGVTTALTEPGTLGMTINEFVERWNDSLEGDDMFTITAEPEIDGSTFTLEPNDVRTRSYSGRSTMTARSARSTRCRLPASWRTVSTAPRVTWRPYALVEPWTCSEPEPSEEEGFQVLTMLDLPSPRSLGDLDPAVLQLKGVRYYVIEGDETTNFIAREDN